MTDHDLKKHGIEDSARGKANDFKGKIKDAMGGLTGKTDLQIEGKMDQAKGKIQDAIGKVKRSLSED